MKLSKKILKSNFVQSLLCLIAYAYIKFTYITTRWHIIGEENVEKMVENNQPFIFALWHGRLLMSGCLAKNYKDSAAIISKHKDGIIIAKILKYFKVKTIWGSTSKGGYSAIKNSIDHLNDSKGVLVITPDGPRGPNRKINGNIVEIAKKADVPIVPITFSFKRYKEINSWDKFLFCYPFNKAVVIIGNQIKIKNNESDYKLLLQKQLNHITDEADKRLK